MISLPGMGGDGKGVSMLDVAAMPLTKVLSMGKGFLEGFLSDFFESVAEELTAGFKLGEKYENTVKYFDTLLKKQDEIIDAIKANTMAVQGVPSATPGGSAPLGFSLTDTIDSLNNTIGELTDAIHGMNDSNDSRRTENPIMKLIKFLKEQLIQRTIHGGRDDKDHVGALHRGLQFDPDVIHDKIRGKFDRIKDQISDKIVGFINSSIGFVLNNPLTSALLAGMVTKFVTGASMGGISNNILNAFDDAGIDATSLGAGYATFKAVSKMAKGPWGLLAGILAGTAVSIISHYVIGPDRMNEIVRSVYDTVDGLIDAITSPFEDVQTTINKLKIREEAKDQIISDLEKKKELISNSLVELRKKYAEKATAATEEEIKALEARLAGLDSIIQSNKDSKEMITKQIERVKSGQSGWWAWLQEYDAALVKEQEEIDKHRFLTPERIQWLREKIGEIDQSIAKWIEGKINSMIASITDMVKNTASSALSTVTDPIKNFSNKFKEGIKEELKKGEASKEELNKDSDEKGGWLSKWFKKKPQKIPPVQATDDLGTPPRIEKDSSPIQPAPIPAPPPPKKEFSSVTKELGIAPRTPVLAEQNKDSSILKAAIDYISSTTNQMHNNVSSSSVVNTMSNQNVTLRTSPDDSRRAAIAW